MRIDEFLLARVAEDEDAARMASRVRETLRGDTWSVSRGQMGVDRIMQDAREVGTGIVEVARHIERHDPARVLAECAAKRAIVDAMSELATLGSWSPDCGGDWTLSGAGYFANCWPDNTVGAFIYPMRGGDPIARSGIMQGKSLAECKRKAVDWIRQNLPSRSPVLRSLALPYADHPDYDEAWRP